jgi:hypothetical protein
MQTRQVWNIIYHPHQNAIVGWLAKKQEHETCQDYISGRMYHIRYRRGGSNNNTLGYKLVFGGEL